MLEAILKGHVIHVFTKVQQIKIRRKSLRHKQLTYCYKTNFSQPVTNFFGTLNYDLNNQETSPYHQTQNF